MTLAFRYPSALDIQDAERESLTYKIKLRAQGVLSKADMNKELERKGIFTSAQHRRKKELIKMIRLMKTKRALILHDEEESVVDWALLEILSGVRVLHKDFSMYTEEIKLKGGHVEELNNLVQTLSKYHKLTIETLVKDFKIKFLLSRCLIRFDENKRQWETSKIFFQELNTRAVEQYAIQFLDFLGGFPSRLIRLVARSPQWYSRWVAATQTGSPLFSGTITEWNTNQLALSYWSMFYDNLSQDPDAPRGDRIKDDDVVDAYLETRSLEREKKNAVPENGKVSGLKAVFKK